MRVPGFPRVSFCPMTYKIAMLNGSMLDEVGILPGSEYSESAVIRFFWDVFGFEWNGILSRSQHFIDLGLNGNRYIYDPRPFVALRK